MLPTHLLGVVSSPLRLGNHIHTRQQALLLDLFGLLGSLSLSLLEFFLLLHLIELVLRDIATPHRQLRNLLSFLKQAIQEVDVVHLKL